jgi:3'-phosphoadenosine 5'-phosphosulfate sulfotransferase (PAPS reductase)/FAD synthetase
MVIVLSIRYIGLFSGGKDSLTTCHYLWEQDKLKEVLYCKTGVGLQENIDYVHDTCQQYGWKLNIVEPKKGETYEDFLRKFGFPNDGAHNMIMGYLKWHPMRKYSRENKDAVLVSGRRNKESKRRMRIATKEYEKTSDGLSFWSPLLKWSNKQVWDYMKKNELQRCPVYETLHMSGDCLCGAFSELGEAEMIQMFYPYMAKRIELWEQQYGYLHPDHNKWGNWSSMKGASTQRRIDKYIDEQEDIPNLNDEVVDLVCNECMFR